MVGHEHRCALQLQQLARHLLVVGVVFHHQHAQTRQTWAGGQPMGGQDAGGVCCGAARYFLIGQSDLKVKPAALTQSAGQPQVTPHQRHQPLADGQAQAGAAKPARGRGFRLRKPGEDARLVVGRNANTGVLHGKLQRDGVCVLPLDRNGHDHLARGREFDGIARQVDEHLLQTHGITHQVAWQRGVNVKQNFQRARADGGRHDDREVAYQRVHAKWLGVQRHLVSLNF